MTVVGEKINKGFDNFRNNKGDLIRNLAYRYNDSSTLRKYYSLGKLINYVVNETINQGYNRINNYLDELRDYLVEYVFYCYQYKY